MTTRTLTNRTDRAEANAQNNLIDKIAFKYKTQFRKEIMRVHTLAQRYVASGASADFALTEHVQKLRIILNNLYKDTAEQFIDYIMKNASVQAQLTRKNVDIENPVITQQMMSEWAEIWSSLLVVRISETTRQQIANIVAMGLSTGMTSEQIGEDIYQKGLILSQARSATIGRTEAHRAANASIFQTVKDVGIVGTKKWVSGQDARVRDSHRFTNGQIREVDEVFQVGNSQLMYPSDPRGEAKETINCRCVLIYNFDE